MTLATVSENKTLNGVGSKTLDLFNKFNYWKIVIWFITQILTGVKFQGWLIEQKIIIYLPGTFGSFTIFFSNTYAFLFSWIAYLLLTFILEGLFIDWVLKFIYILSYRWNRVLQHLLGGELPDETEEVRRIAYGVFGLPGLFGKFLFCGACTAFDWWINSYKMIQSADTWAGEFVAGGIMFILVISGEFLLNMDFIALAKAAKKALGVAESAEGASGNGPEETKTSAEKPATASNKTQAKSTTNENFQQ